MNKLPHRTSPTSPERRSRYNRVPLIASLAAGVLLVSGCTVIINDAPRPDKIEAAQPTRTPEAQTTTAAPSSSKTETSTPAAPAESTPKTPQVSTAPKETTPNTTKSTSPENSWSAPKFSFSGDKHNGTITGVMGTNKAQHRIKVDLHCSPGDGEVPTAGYSTYYNDQQQTSVGPTKLKSTFGYDPCTKSGELSDKVKKNPGFYALRLVNSVATKEKVTSPVKDWVSDKIR